MILLSEAKVIFILTSGLLYFLSIAFESKKNWLLLKLLVATSDNLMALISLDA